MNHVVEKPTVEQLACDIDECIHRDRKADHPSNSELSHVCRSTKVSPETHDAAFTPLVESSNALSTASNACGAPALPNGTDELTTSPEHQVCKKLLVLLDRQRQERVAAALEALQDELDEAESKPCKHVPTCLLGHALSNMALGHHDEARAILTELGHSAMDNEFVAANAVRSLSHIGDIRAARDLAFQVRERFSDSVDVLRNVTRVFENCVDLVEASATASKHLELVTDRSGRIKGNLWLYSQLQFQANHLGIDFEALFSHVEFAVEIIRGLGRHIHQIRFGGPIEAVSIYFYVNATTSQAWHDSVTLTETLWNRPGEELISEIVPLGARPLYGRIRRPSQINVQIGRANGIA
ncbi:protein of unknown function [Pararobbsia alpina]|uniref:hypothetical protein n=1 Tax=Pararobbsia alpina TaxID=621374 RepID=UPI0039A4980B